MISPTARADELPEGSLDLRALAEDETADALLARRGSDNREQLVAERERAAAERERQRGRVTAAERRRLSPVGLERRRLLPVRDRPRRVLPVEEIQRGQTVTGRPRPELEPLGLRAGGFLIYPRLGLEEIYDDNIFSVDEDEVGDFITQVLPGIKVESDWGVHALNFEGDAAIGRYADNAEENYEDIRLGADGRLDITHGSFLAGGLAYKSLHEARGSPDDVAGTEPTEFNILSADLGYFHRLGRLGFELLSTFDRWDVDDVSAVAGGITSIINNDDRDRDIFEASLRIGYEIVPEYEAFIRGAYNFRNYDSDVDDLGFDRDSDGFDITAGVAVDFGGVTFGEFLIGYQSQDFDDPALDTIDGVVVAAEVVWNLTRLTTAKGFARTRTGIGETTLAGTSGVFTTSVGASVDHELLRNLLLGAFATGSREDFEGVSRIDDVIHVGLDATYMLNRHLYASAGYSYRRRDSDVPAGDFDRNVFIVGLEAQY